jgi:hypothetical protein
VDTGVAFAVRAPAFGLLSCPKCRGGMHDLCPGAWHEGRHYLLCPCPEDVHRDRCPAVVVRLRFPFQCGEPDGHDGPHRGGVGGQVEWTEVF